MTLKPFVCLLGLLLSFAVAVSAQDFGVQLGSFQKDLSTDAPSAMKKIKDMGFSHIQMDKTYGLSFPQLIKLLAVNDLSVISLETSLEKLAQSPQAVVDEARTYGARFIVCTSAPSTKVFSKEEAARIASVLNHAGKIVSQNGLLLCYQPKAHEFRDVDNYSFDDFITKLERGIVYLGLDVCAVKKAGKEPVALLRKYPTRFVLVYLEDKKLSPGADTLSTVSLGNGDVGILDVMKTARDLGIQYFFIADNSPQAEQHLSEGLAYLKSINDHSRK